MPILLQLQKLPWKGDGGWEKKVSLRRFLADQKIASPWGKKEEKKEAFLGILQHEQQVIAYCRTQYDYGASKNAFKVGSVKFANSLSPPSIAKKVRTGSKSSQGTSAMPGKSQGS